MHWNRRNRIALLLAIGGLLIGGALFYIQYYLQRPVGEGPAGPSIDPGRFASVWSDRPVLLVGIGDSITAGMGAQSIHHGYFQRLTKNPKNEFPDMQGITLTNVLPNIASLNLALSGSTSDRHLEIIEEQLPVQGLEVFGIVVMTTGGNDLIHHYGKMPPRECAMYGATLKQATPWIAAYRQRLEAILETIHDRFPGGCEIYLADIYDPTDGVGDGASVGLPDWPDGLRIHAAYNQVIADCAAARTFVHVVPLHETFLGHGSHCRQFWQSNYDQADPYYWYFDNVEDPNDRGHDAIRRLFLQAISQHSALTP